MNNQFKELNHLPFTKNFVSRQDDLDNLLEKIAATEAMGNFPLIHIGGIPLTGKSTFVGHYVKNVGKKPIWIGSRDVLQDETAILGEIGLILKDQYHQPEFYQYYQQNITNNVPGTYRTITYRNLARCLSLDEYVLVLDNFHFTNQQSGVNDLITNVVKLTEANRQRSKFKAIILISEDKPKIFWENSIEIYLGGFKSVSQTEELVKKCLKRVSLSQEQINLLHEKTEGHPGVIELFIMYLSLLNSSEIETVLKGATNLLMGLERVEKVQDFLLDRIDSKLSRSQKTILEIVSQLRQPFILMDAFSIMAEYDHKLEREDVFELCGYYFIRQATDAEIGSMYYHIHRLLRDRFSNNLIQDARNKIHHIAAVYYDGKEDYCNAGAHHIEEGNLSAAATILTDPLKRDKIYASGKIGVYIGLLSELKSKKFQGHKDLLLLIHERMGDASEVSSDYATALENYNDALNLCPEKNVLKKAEILRKLGWSYQRIPQWSTSLEMYQQALNILEGDTNPKYTLEIGRSKIQMGHVYFKKLEYEKALDTCNDGIVVLNKFIEKEGRTVLERVERYLAQGHLFRGLVYYGQGKYDLALRDFEEAMRLYKHDEDDYGVCQTNLYLAMVHSSLDTNDLQANEYLDAAYKDSKRLSFLKIEGDYHRQKAKLLMKIRSLDSDTKNLSRSSTSQEFIDTKAVNLDEAILELKRAIELQQRIDSIYDLAWSHNTLAICYYSLGDYDTAKSEWLIAKDMLIKSESINDIKAIDANLAFLDKIKGDFRNPRKTWQEALSFARKNNDHEWELDALVSLLELDLFTESNRSRVKEKIAECKAKSILPGFERYQIRIQYLEGIYHIDGDNLEKSLEIIESCCEEKNAIYFDVYYPHILQRVELYILLKKPEKAKTAFEDAVRYLSKYQSKRMFMARIERARSLYLVSSDADSALKATNESVKLFSEIGAPLFVAGTQHKVGRALKYYGYKNLAENLLRESLLFFDNNRMSAKSAIIRKLLDE